MHRAEPLWWQSGIIYQIYPRSFQDSNGDGIGDLNGIAQRLDYLHVTLGIDAIWLSPFYPSPMADFGYDISNYLDVDPCFGDLDRFDQLVHEAHHRDIQVIVDFVPNHTSSEHPWFVESRSSRDNSKRDWYIWKDPNPDGDPPNNWLSVFGGGAWEFDSNTGQYYLHSFLEQQPDLNWRNPAVRAEMINVLRYWLQRGVDGFRIDVAHHIMKDPEFRDNPPAPPGGHAGRGSSYDSQVHVYDKGHADVHDVFREIRRTLDESQPGHAMAVGEIYEFDWQTWATYYGGQLDELHMPFNFALLNVPWTAADVRSVVDSTEAAVPPGAWPNYVLGNHDQHRVASRIGLAQSRVAMMLLLTLRGTPTVYYGDEIGMHDVPILPEQIRDPVEFREPGLELGRDPERTPMQWDTSKNSGFCRENVNPWLPVADDYDRVNVEVERRDPTSMLSLTRHLIKVRRTTGALVHGAYRPVTAAPPDCFVFERVLDNQTCLIALNFSDQVREINLSERVCGRLLASTYQDREGDTITDCVTLRANEGCVAELIYCS